MKESSSHDYFSAELALPVPAAEAFAWHERPGTFERLQPPWEPLKILKKPTSLEPGNVVELESKLGPFPLKMRFVHGAYRQGELFCDSQERGPFRTWRHEHRFLDRSGGSVLEDVIQYEIPGGSLGRRLAGKGIRKRIERMFAYRHAITHHDLSMANTEKITFLITGISGLIGSAVRAYLESQGHTVRGLSRNPQGDHQRHWDPEKGVLDKSDLEGVDVVLHLAGESIDQRWNSEAMNRIRKSRKISTRLLADRMASLEQLPALFFSASGINYYGDRAEGSVDESSEPGDSFLADVCREWESATQPAEEAGIRVIHLRTGVVLDPRGGILDRLLPLFTKGLGGKVGSGKQRVSWILLEDYIAILEFLRAQTDIEGPVNVVTPHPVTNEELVKALGKVLGKPTAIPVPALAVKAALGRMGKALALGDLAVQPQVLKDHDYSFRYPEIEPALAFILGKSLQDS